jgi:hypothetical protein
LLASKPLPAEAQKPVLYLFLQFTSAGRKRIDRQLQLFGGLSRFLFCAKASANLLSTSSESEATDLNSRSSAAKNLSRLLV